MTERPCKLSDLRVRLDVMPDIAVAADGTPNGDDLLAAARLLTANWRDETFEWYYCCANCWEESITFKDRHCVVGEQSAERSLTSFTVEYQLTTTWREPLGIRTQDE